MTAFSPSEIMFLQMMIPHHEQAVTISALAESQTQNAAILDIAKRISEAQQPEIDQMKKLLTDAALPTLMDHDMGMNGMIPQSDLDKLTQVQDAAFDKQWRFYWLQRTQQLNFWVSRRFPETVLLKKSPITPNEFVH